MKRRLVIASTILLVATALHASPSKPVPVPVPDFWYVVPNGAPVAAAGLARSVRGIVVPSSVHPAVRTTPAGSVISWGRPDGTRQSFAVAGMSSFAFEPGPLEGTTFVPFFAGIIYHQPPNSCCTCASWENSEESAEAQSCVVGCIGCGCEGCICSTGPTCRRTLESTLTLVAHNDPTSIMTFAKRGDRTMLTDGDNAETSARFQGARLSAGLSAEGETVIRNADSITLPGGVEARVVVKGDRALYAWSSPVASVILEQPRTMPAPSLSDGTIELTSTANLVRASAVKRPEIAPLMDRCSVCGTHPNSDGDVDSMQCVPGFSVCYRCISWECFGPGN